MDPLKQFSIQPLVRLPELFGRINIDFTNSSLYMLIAVLLACLVLWLGVKDRKLVPGKWQAFTELIYNFITSIIEGSCGKEGLKYTGLIFTIFIFILFCNIAGLLPLPMSFTVTSHIIVTFALALLVFIFVTYVGLKKQKLGFFSLFLPAGTPWWLAPLMILLETFTYLFRPVSLSIRLAANMIAGHTILKVIASFVSYEFLTVSPLSFIFVMILTVFELFIAMLQAYIFAILTCVYLSDSLAKH